MTCDRCGQSLELACTVVKDGAVHHAYKCPLGHHLLVASLETRLRLAFDAHESYGAVRLECGPNCYIFDERLFKAAFREVLAFARRETGDLILNLGSVALVAEPLLGVIRLLDHGLRGRGRSLWIVAASRLVAADLIRLDPALDGRVERSEADVLLRLQSATV
ncbi:MAG: hypothetical protein EXS14_02745 [Planctomycetes bacterium]|nr:hypothetical protein [Planctomycetota bacterium]